jgi:hypothetical protein
LCGCHGVWEGVGVHINTGVHVRLSYTCVIMCELLNSLWLLVVKTFIFFLTQKHVVSQAVTNDDERCFIHSHCCRLHGNYFSDNVEKTCC